MKAVERVVRAQPVPLPARRAAAIEPLVPLPVQLAAAAPPVPLPVQLAAATE